MTDKPQVHRFVLTGGPCGGKTTALARLSERLHALGYRVFVVPEIPTMITTGGVSFCDLSPEELVHVEEDLLRTQIAMEDTFVTAAWAATGPSIVICDRGTMDVSAYLPPPMWETILERQRWTAVALRDERYDAVVHLVTAAEGAEAFYTTSNNAARRETPEEAKAIDRKLREAWLGHPHLRVIDNGTDFANKVQRVLQAFYSVLGVPESLEIERKYLVKKVPDGAEFPVRSVEIEIEQVYLRTKDGSEARIRRRGPRESCVCTHTVKRPHEAGQRVEVERTISRREYLSYGAQADPARRPIRKRRRCFLWEHQYFEIDTFESPCQGLVLLEVELEGADQIVSLPPFLEIEREVTGDARYSNVVLAGGDFSPGFPRADDSADAEALSPW